MSSHHWTEINGHLHRDTGRFRYVWPSELDLMARLASMRLVNRWEDGRKRSSLPRVRARWLLPEISNGLFHNVFVRGCRSPDVTVLQRCPGDLRPLVERSVLLCRYHELGVACQPKTGQGVNVREEEKPRPKVPGEKI